MIKKIFMFILKNGISALIERLLFKICGCFFPYDFQIAKNIIDRPNYAYCCLSGARLAKRLGLKKISVIEFGCAGGNGLVALEKITSEVEKLTGVQFEIYGFDTGEGLPEPVDYRDLPYHWKADFFSMDKTTLEKNLSKSKIIYGNVNETAVDFFSKYSPSPVACIFHDLDFYSSTKSSFKLITDKNRRHFLPRVFNYFDDIIGGEIECYNEFTGELLAISEFNHENKKIKFAKAHNLIFMRYQQTWYHQIRILHFFEHERYCEFISEDNQQIPLID